MTIPALRAAADEARTWLFERAGPLWAGAGLTANGLFAELLGPDGKPSPSVLRLRVQARQIYCMSELGALGWTGPWREAAERGLEALFAHGRREDGLYVHKLNADGSTADARPDLYDHAFVLFALVNASKALTRPDLLAEGDALMDRLDAWKHPAGGFTEGEVDPQPPRRQNPHMHMLECSIAYWRAGAPARWEAQARALAELARTRFIEPQTGALTEYFQDDWSRRPGEEGRRSEPGHCFEWTWLEENLTALGVDGSRISDGLVGFARAHGVDPKRNVAFNETDLDGAVRDGKARLWPQTERMKAGLARFRRTADPAEAEQALAGLAGLKLYLDAPGPGLWRDKMQADGSFVEEPSPASSFYHIVCGLSELIQTAG